MYFQLKRLINDPKNRNFWSKICSFWRFWGVRFDLFGSLKRGFLDFFKVVLELFSKCLGILLRLKRTILRFFALRLILKLHTYLWGPAEAILNFDYASLGLFILNAFLGIIVLHNGHAKWKSVTYEIVYMFAFYSSRRAYLELAGWLDVDWAISLKICY